jgi:hypothetical protein
LQWNAPVDTGGGPLANVDILKYRVWLQLPNAAASLLAEVPGRQTSFEVSIPLVFSPKYFFYVTAVNKEHEGLPSTTLELVGSAPPGQVSPPALIHVDGQRMQLAWNPPSAVTRGCNELLAECEEINSQYPLSNQATSYELYWDAGLGGTPTERIYVGGMPMANVRLPAQVPGMSVPNVFRFRARALAAAGFGLFSHTVAISGAPPAVPTNLQVALVQHGVASLIWSGISDPPTSLWYEVHSPTL